MTTGADRKMVRRGERRQRWRRFCAVLNVVSALALLGVLVGMVNYFAARHYSRWNISRSGYFQLSEKTEGLLGGLESDVMVVGFFRKNNSLYDSVKKLLEEYRYAAEKQDPVRLTVRVVDPDRDLAEARELKRKYDLADADTVLFECEDRVKYVSGKEIADYQVQLTESGAVKKWVGFKGEEAFSSAIQSVVQSSRPVVYFLGGHGERSPADFSKHAGLSSLGRIMVRDNIEIRHLVLEQETGIPVDCSALIIAGPDRRLAQPELDMLAEYLEKSGRMLVMLDPVTETGLEPLLADWGIKLANDVVVGLTLTGRELVVARYGNHPITQRFRNMTTLFYMPRSVEAATGTESADKPRVSALALNSDKGWAEHNLEQKPARYDEDSDRRGPISVAVAAERGAVSGIVLEIKPTRLVVIGDSYFVANGALASGVGGNADFFMSAVNWLVERENLLGIGPKTPEELRLDMSRGRLQAAYLAIAGGIPGLVAVVGLCVWLMRRR